MRASFLLFLLMAFSGLILWVSLSGPALVVALLLLLMFAVLSAAYYDKALMFFMGAREVTSADSERFQRAARQEAYKLSLPVPKLYFYHGSIERGFLLQNNRQLSLVLNKGLLDQCSLEELSAICFGLLLQAKKNMAAKRTKVMFLIGLLSWFVQAFAGILAKILPVREVQLAVSWVLIYVLQPWLDLIFAGCVGEQYFRKLQVHLEAFPHEKEMLQRFSARLTIPREISSFASRKALMFQALDRSRHFQNILGMEFLPHEWDRLTSRGDQARA